MQVAPVDTSMEEIEYQRYQKFKTYRELTETNLGESAPGILLADRHNYFVKFHKNLKDAAKKIINNDYVYDDNYKAQVMDLFAALKITPKFATFPGVKTAEKMVQIEIDCDYDAYFLDVESKIYKSVIEYFRDMLY